jgi:5-bromo-4-chloroindolyl phosphate hydrolysis protein
MVDMMEEIMEGRSELPRHSVRDRLEGRSMSAVRTLIKRFKERLPVSHNRPEFQRHRYPEVSLEEIRARMSRFQQILGDSRELKVELTANQFFRISL